MGREEQQKSRHNDENVVGPRRCDGGSLQTRTGKGARTMGWQRRYALATMAGGHGRARPYNAGFLTPGENFLLTPVSPDVPQLQSRSPAESFVHPHFFRRIEIENGSAAGDSCSQ